MSFLVAGVVLFALMTADDIVTEYRCLDDTRFVLRANSAQAVVEFPNARYVLPRRPSALATKYASEKATLYLDGNFAAFVADDRAPPGCKALRHPK